MTTTHTTTSSFSTTSSLLTSSEDLAVLRAQVSEVEDLGDACPRCQSADVCPAWCVEADEPVLWACDGCTFTGTADECDAHVDSQVLRADGTVADWADVVCHGSYLVGGPAWEAHVFHGVHPMSVLVADIRDAVTGSTLNLPEVSMSTTTTTTTTLSTSSRDLAVLRARVSGDIAHLRAFVSGPAELGDACPRCESDGACPRWCVDAD